MFFFFNDTATTEIYTLSLHDALPILGSSIVGDRYRDKQYTIVQGTEASSWRWTVRLDEKTIKSGHLHERSEEHTSELQSHLNLVCRLLLEKKKTKQCRHSS